jgi:hypothetical protein
MISAKTRILSCGESWRTPQPINSDRSACLSGGPTGPIQVPFLPADDPFRPIFSDVSDGTIVALAPIEGITLAEIAEVSRTFKGLAPHENARVPKNGTRIGGGPT